MKTLLNKIGLLIGGLVVLVACADFDELNQDPRAANSDQVQVEYFINNSIIGAQQDPHVAERACSLLVGGFKTGQNQHPAHWIIQ